MERAFDSAHRT